MDIIKSAQEWAKAEIISSVLFIGMGVIYMLTALGFWQWGNSTLTKAMIIPILVAGGLLLSAGAGFYMSNKQKLNSFPVEYSSDPIETVNKEIFRAEKTIKTYENVALKVFPIVVLFTTIAASFVHNQTIKAICIAIVAFLLVLIVLDSQALKRFKVYHKQLQEEQIRLK